jgi:hypothetical protein
LLASGIFLSTPASADVLTTVTTELLTPLSEIQTGRNIHIRVSVAQNETGIPVKGVCFRIVYDTTAVASITNPFGEAAQDLGPVSAGPATLISGTQYYRQFATNPNNLTPPITNLTPRCFIVTAKMRNGTMTPTFSITAEDGSTTPVWGVDGTALEHGFDNSATTNVPTACKVATNWLSQCSYATPLATGTKFGGILPNYYFHVQGQVVSNNNLATNIPQRMNMRLYYDSNMVQWPQDMTVVSRQRVSSQIILTFDQPHPYVVNSLVRVNLQEPAATAKWYNGDFTVNLVPSATQVRLAAFSPPGAPANDPDAATVGTVSLRSTAGNMVGQVLVGNEFTLGTTQYKYRDIQNGLIPLRKSRSATACTLVVPGGHNFAAGGSNFIIVDIGDPEFDGVFAIASQTVGTIVYNFAGAIRAETDVANPNARIWPNYNPGGTAGLPILFTLFLQGKNVAQITPFTVWLEDTPSVNGLERGNPPATAISHYLDSRWTRFTPIIKTELADPGKLTNLKVGDSFDVFLKVENNDTGFIPCSFFTRVNFDSSFLSVPPVNSGYEQQIGPVRDSSVFGTPPDTYNDYYSDGTEYEFKWTYTTPNPVAAKLTFTLTAPPPGPFSITLSDTPSWNPQGIGGLADRDQSDASTKVYIPHVLDSTATTGFEVERVVATELMGDVIRPGDTFRVKVRVASNDTAVSVPVACAFRVAYHGDAVSLESAAIGDLGAVNIGAPQGSGAGAYSDVSADPNQANMDPLPTCYILTFRVKPNPVAPFSVSLSDDPASAAPLQGKGDGVYALSHVFDSSATQNLVADPIVITEWIEGDIMPGEQFKVRVRVLGNSGPGIPISSLFRVNFTSESLVLLTPPPSSVLQSGTIGPPYAGPLNHDGGLGMAYRTIGTLGNTNNTELNPTCFIMTFEVKSAPVTPFSITLQAPASGTPLPAKGTYANISHAYDSSRTTNLSTMTKPVVVTEVASGSPQYIEGQFQVRVRVDSNDSFTTPGAAAFRVYYTTPSLTLLVAETQATGEGDLGAVSVGPEVGTATPGLVYREVWTAGNTANTNKLATCFLVTFAVGRDSARPFDITVADTAMPGVVPLMGVDSTVLPHTFDPAETLGLGLPTIPPAGVGEWQTLGVGTTTPIRN